MDSEKKINWLVFSVISIDWPTWNCIVSTIQSKHESNKYYTHKKFGCGKLILFIQNIFAFLWFFSSFKSTKSNMIEKWKWLKTNGNRTKNKKIEINKNRNKIKKMKMITEMCSERKTIRTRTTIKRWTKNTSKKHQTKLKTDFFYSSNI